jgi:predicted N-acetyltransferase YhbS
MGADQATIRAIVRAARINPFHLEWPHFLVAEVGGQIVGVGQIKPHPDGSRELASLAVVPERQGHGIGGQLVSALQERASGTLYLRCLQGMETYYRRFGFRRVEAEEMSPFFQTFVRRYRLFQRVSSVFVRGGIRLSVMKWEPHEPSA